MTAETYALDLVRTALVVTIKVSAPILLAGLVVGLVISVMQSVTSIQDQALSFVPKIVVMVLVAALLTPWIAERLLAFTVEMFQLM